MKGKKYMRTIKLLAQIPRPRIALVGEAPGADEDRLGRPFIGYEGKYLRRLLKSAGINPSHCHITNTVHERPPGNIYDKLSRTAIQFGIEELERDLVQWQKEGLTLVVAIGARALEALTGKSGITKYRGTVLPCSLVPGLKVLATIHPGGVIRGSGKMEPVLILDFKKALNEAKTKELVYPRREIKIVADIAEARALITKFTNYNSPLACDIETAGGKMTAYGFAPKKDLAYVFTKEVLEAPSFLRLLAKFARSTTPKIFHNALFDCFHNAYYYKIVNKNILFDTMLAQHDCYPTLPKSLAFCASVYTNEPYWKDVGRAAVKKSMRRLLVDWDALYEYNGKDCCLTYEVYEALQEELDGWGTRQAFDLDMALVEPCLFAMVKGIRIDQGAVKTFARKNERAIEVLTYIKDKVIGPVNTRSHKQLKELMYGEWDLPKQYKKRKLTTEDKKLAKLERFPTPHKYKIGLIRMLNHKLKQRDFYTLDLDEDGRVRTALKIHGTYTGRWSSSKSITGSGSNLQNQPKEVRAFYTPDHGKIFIQMDLSQSEARIVAALCKDLEWLHKFDTVDQHRRVAAALFNVAYNDVTTYQRNIAKRVAHASHYHLGWMLLSEILGCSAAEAKAHKARYFEVRPKLNNWHRLINTEVKRTRLIRTCFNRVIQFFGPHFDSMVTDATAAEPQSVSASYLNAGLKRCYYEIPEFEFLLQVHDSILCQVPDDVSIIARVIKQMKEVTEQEIVVRGVPLTIPANFEIGYDWYHLVEVKDVSDIESIRKEARNAM